MSSNKNSNQPIQGIANSPSSSDFSNPRQTPAANSMRPQLTVPSNQATSSHRGRYGRRLNRGRGKQGLLSRSDDNSNPRAQLAQNESVRPESTSIDNPTSSQSAAERVAKVVVDKGTKDHKENRGGSSKYKQRHHTNQLLDGMSNLDGLDIDLAESIVPTSSNGRSADHGKGRHGTNSRKVNLTHLLNYKFERQQGRGGRYAPAHTDGSSSYHHRSICSHYRDPGTQHKFNKQQFLQANCQFVVLDGHDYTVHKADPDWPVDWDCIEEVRFKQSASTETTCPICLEPPVAAKITRCGHIYCWPCMLHYLSLSDENCRQCPICFEPVYKSDLRSVVSHSFINYSVEEDIVMRLMFRRKGCVEVEPYKVGSVVHSKMDTCSLEGSKSAIKSDQYWSQANLVIVDSSTVIKNIAQRERRELLLKLETDRNEPEVCFIDQALSLLSKREEKLSLRTSSPSLRSSKVDHQELFACDRNISTQFASNPELGKSYLFYQCSDGQHIYLNPFSTKILCHEYKDLENCPLEISAKILQMDWISMSEAWRKRFRYLEHLPLTCEFRLIEIDFENSSLVSPDTFKVFEDQIKRREKERERRRREERKREKIIQVEQDRKIYGIQPSLKINLNNIDQFPSVSDERYLGLTQPRNQSRSEEYLSSDNEEVDSAHVPASNELPIPSPDEPDVGSVVKDDSSINAVSGITLSFKDIQLQEAARAEAESMKQNSSGSKASAWNSKKTTNKAQGSGGVGTQSSFAKLLVDAKASQKEWTRNPVSWASNPSAPRAHVSSQGPNQASSSDDGSGELRAPLSDFTISDFIDLKVVSGTSGKKKGKLKSTSKKG